MEYWLSRCFVNCARQMYIVGRALLSDDKIFESAFLQVEPRNRYFKIWFLKRVLLGLGISLMWSLDPQQLHHLEMYPKCKFLAAPTYWIRISGSCIPSFNEPSRWPEPSKKLRTAGLGHYFSSFSIHTDHLEVLLKCLGWGGGRGEVILCFEGVSKRC